MLDVYQIIQLWMKAGVPQILGQDSNQGVVVVVVQKSGAGLKQPRSNQEALSQDVQGISHKSREGTIRNCPGSLFHTKEQM